MLALPQAVCLHLARDGLPHMQHSMSFQARGTSKDPMAVCMWGWRSAAPHASDTGLHAFSAGRHRTESRLYFGMALQMRSDVLRYKLILTSTGIYLPPTACLPL